jgi:hypothetical protein
MNRSLCIYIYRKGRCQVPIYTYICISKWFMFKINIIVHLNLSINININKQINID